MWRLEAYRDGQAQRNSWGCCQGSSCWPLPYAGPRLEWWGASGGSSGYEQIKSWEGRQDVGLPKLP